MAETTKRTVQLSILTTGFKLADQGLANIGKRLKEVDDAAKRAGGGLSGALGGLNQTFKGAGLTGDAGLIGLLRGGGAAAAGVFAADVLKGTAQAFIDVRDGAKDMAQAIRDAAESIPVLGRIFGAGGAIREAFTGEKAQMKLVEEVGKLIEDRSKDARELSERVRGLIEGERSKLNSVFGERGSSVDTARRAYDDDLAAIEKKFTDTLRTITGRISNIVDARVKRSGWQYSGSDTEMRYVEGEFTDAERQVLDSLEQERRLLQAQREQIRRQLGDLGEFAAMRAGQREQLESFRGRLQRAGREGRGREYQLPDFGAQDRFGTGLSQAGRERITEDRQAKAIEQLVAEMRQLIKALETDRDAGFIGQLQEMIDDALNSN